MDQSRRSKTCL